MSNSSHRTEQPDLVEQALEAAQDDPSRNELVSMLDDIPWVSYVQVDHHDLREAPTLISVHFTEHHGTGTGPVVRIMRRAGWKTNSVCFSMDRITFIEGDYHD